MWRFLLPLIMLAQTPSPAVPTQVSADPIVKRLQARYDATKDFTATVSQDLEIASLGRTLSAHGTVAFKRPGRMRWELTNHQQQTIVADGTSLWVYTPSQNQVFKASFKDAFESTTPVSFLVGMGRIADDFKATTDGEAGGLVYVRLVPRVGEAMGTLRLGLDQKTYDVREAEVKDPLGNVTRLRFSDIKRDVGMPDDQFTFAVPKGVEVIEAPPSMR